MTYLECVGKLDKQFDEIQKKAIKLMHTLPGNNLSDDMHGSKKNRELAHKFLDKIYFHMIDYFMDNFDDAWTYDYGDIDSELGDAMDCAQFIRYGSNKFAPKNLKNQWVATNNWYSYILNPHIDYVPSKPQHVVNLQDVVNVCKYLDDPFKETLKKIKNGDLVNE